MQHIVPLQTNIAYLHYFNLTPKFEWRERWYTEKMNYAYDNDGNIEKKKIPGFVRVYDCDVSATLKTTLYGIYQRNQDAIVQALRHEFEPIVSFMYTPYFTSCDYWQTMKGGKKNGEKFNRLEQAIYGAPSDNSVALLKIKLSNRLSMKIKNSANARKSTLKIPILENFDWSTGYDFLKKEYPWDDIKFETGTSILDRVFSFNLKAEIDPYSYHKNSNQRQYIRSTELAWCHGQGLGHVKKISFNVSAKLSNNSSARPNSSDTSGPQDDHGIKSSSKAPTDNQHASKRYVNFTIPWDLNLRYQWSFSRAKPGDTPKKTSSINLEGRIRLTSKWQVACKSVYDFTKFKWVGNATSIHISRDLHCWEMDFDWNPLGDTQVYRFSVGLKAPLLKDLKGTRNRSYPKY